MVAAKDEKVQFDSKVIRCFTFKYIMRLRIIRFLGNSVL